MMVRGGRFLSSTCARSRSLLGSACGVFAPSCTNVSSRILPARIAVPTALSRRPAPIPRRLGATGAIGIGIVVFVAAACTTRLTNDERVKVEFWGTISAEAEAGVRELDDEGRRELVAALPVAERERSWQGVLEVLDDRPTLEPLADRIHAVVDAETDAGVRLELATPSGNAHLRELILTSIQNGLAARPAAP